MKCEQKSGVFLNINCSHNSKKSCESCKKNVCKKHLHRFKGETLCENCYWEKYLYAEKQYNSEYSYQDNSTIFVTGTSTSSSSNEAEETGGFDQGFGGGEFGGGGASSEWTEGDMQSFDITNNDIAESGTFLTDDNTFFYS